ncbi:hypothetical protein [Pedobacter psychrodurus]|nr:hypothetical protein [Pedobacter psychrodurus]
MKIRSFNPKPDCTDAVFIDYFLFPSFKNGRRESGAIGRHEERNLSLSKR